MKGDLNLLPLKKSAISKELLALIIALLSVVILIVGYFFVFVPNSKKLDLNKEIKDKEKELEEYVGLDSEFDTLIAERTRLSEFVASLDVVGNANVLLSEVLVDIDDSTPVGVLLDTMEYSNRHMSFRGRTRGMIRIAQFLVKLRQMDNVIAVKLHDVKYLDPKDLHNTPNENENIDNALKKENNDDALSEEKIYEFEQMPYYDFEISIYYNFNQVRNMLEKVGE